MLLRILILVTLIVYQHVSCGAVGECRTECVEQNRFKIVRVHLKNDLVMVGVCQNITNSEDGTSFVSPFICNKKLGMWKFDENDEEGVTTFQIPCPPNFPVSPERLAACLTTKR